MASAPPPAQSVAAGRRNGIMPLPRVAANSESWIAALTSLGPT
jgi:hypothetical protein